MSPNARLTEQIFDGGFCAYFCTKGDSGNLSGAAVGYTSVDLPFLFFSTFDITT